jgi:N,N'-diacetyllegionaminate synthase
MAKIIAEIGSVHDGSLGNALCLIDAAADCGADAVKFQTHIAEAETLPDAPMPPYFEGEPRFQYFKRTGFSRAEWKSLKEKCAEKNVQFMSSPFSEEAVDLLETIGMEVYKIPSGEVTNLPLLEKIALLKKPIILSSGMSTWDELDQSVSLITKHHSHLTILQCTSEYSCPYERVGLNAMLEMKNRYGLPVGLSDHTLTPYAAFAAVTQGASIIEKHFTFSRRVYGSDARHSMEPDEFAMMVQGIRAIEIMLKSQVDKNSLGNLASMKEIFEKSIIAKIYIPAGAEITMEMLCMKKPGTGLQAARIGDVVGKKARRDIIKDSFITIDDLIT